MNDASTQDVLKSLDILIHSGTNKVSISIIQRKMGYRFNRAADVLRELVESGIVVLTENNDGIKVHRLNLPYCSLDD